MNKKINQLRNWLRGHVVSPSTPKAITLNQFKFDEKDFQGRFKVTVDNLRLNSEFSFSVDISGRYEISPPMYISPIGLPASYPSIELTDETTEEIISLINKFFPKIKPLGLDKDSGKFIDRNTPMLERVVDVEYTSRVIDEITSEDFELKCSIKR